MIFGYIGLLILVILAIKYLDRIKYYYAFVYVKVLKTKIIQESKKIKEVHNDLEELKANKELSKLKILRQKREKKFIERRFDEYIKCYNDKYIQYYQFCLENGFEVSDEFFEIDGMIDDIEKEFKPKKALERELKLVTKKYDICYSLVNSSGEKLFKSKMKAIRTIDKSVSLINSIAKHPKNFDTDVEQIVVHKGKFKDAVDYAKEQSEDLKKSLKGIGAGVAVGGTFATVAPTTAMWVATTFGTASTGTAISALSGPVATNAALAWLGGGAVAACGGGVAAGQALLALAGPIGWGIAGTSILASIFIVVKNDLNNLKV